MIISGNNGINKASKIYGIDQVKSGRGSGGSWCWLLSVVGVGSGSAVVEGAR